MVKEHHLPDLNKELGLGIGKEKRPALSCCVCPFQYHLAFGF